MYSLTGINDGPSKYSMSVSMYRGGARGYGRPRSAPPDLPSLLLDARIVYLGMPVRHHVFGQCSLQIHALDIHRLSVLCRCVIMSFSIY